MAMMSTKLTKGGQTTVPKEIRTALGIGDEGRVYWFLDGQKAYVLADVQMPNAVTDVDQFWDGIAQSEASVAAGHAKPAHEASAAIRERYELA